MPTTHIAVILDKSGSMEGVKGETISGFNDYLVKLQEDPGAADMRLTLTLFDTTCLTPVVAEPVANVNPLDATRYQPSGFTALYDAIGSTVRQASSAVEDGGRALVVIITDGQENSSKDSTKAEIVQLIKDYEAKGNWSFAYLSAAPSAFADAQGIGIQQASTAAYAGTGTGTKAAFLAAATSTRMYTSSASPQSLGFFAQAGIGSVIDDPGRIEPPPQSASSWIGGRGSQQGGQTPWTKP